MEMQYLKIVDGRAVAPAGFDPDNIAHRKRLDYQRRILDLGLSPDILSDIVDEFYARVRTHPILRPIFDQKIGTHWEHHLANMKTFWISVALNAGTYTGKPVITHKALQDIKPFHFSIWLGLFKQTVLDLTGSSEACEFLMKRAEKMANTFKKAMFGETFTDLANNTDPSQKQEPQSC